MKTIRVVTGQTATGKTAYALSLASQIQGDLINCDSRQIYKQTDIVTGKDIPPGAQFTSVYTLGSYDIGYYTLIDPSSGKPVRLWLYDIVDPSEPFSAFAYANCALKVIHYLFEENRIPIVIGGTYFYLHQLLYGETGTDSEPDWQKRKELEEKPVDELQKLLQLLNPDLFASLNNSDRHNPHRLIRKIELAEEKGPEYMEGAIDVFENKLSAKLGESGINVVIEGRRYSETEQLRAAIRSRVEERLKNGAIAETQTLLQKGYTLENPGLHALGYKEIVSFLQNDITETQLIDLWSTHESQYAKRQYTFMKRNPYILWNNVS